MNLDELRSHFNKRVKLEFKDGEVVEALLLGADLQRDRDLTYEVLKVVRPGRPKAKGTAEGATCIAKVADLASWEPLEGDGRSN